jgi:mannitol/fructose-specific phosphotransferase system IIA component (Ntr-type)
MWSSVQYPARGMRFVAALRPELIHIAPPWRTFRETVSGLVEMLQAQGVLSATHAPDAVRAVTTREADASTALLDIGVGIPHARLPGLDGVMTALALSSRGLYEAVPMVTIHIVALVLSPAVAAQEHLQLLANVAMSLRSPELRAALLQAPDGAAALDALAKHTRPES